MPSASACATNSSNRPDSMAFLRVKCSSFMTLV
jgi:hypothetical protein